MHSEEYSGRLIQLDILRPPASQHWSFTQEIAQRTDATVTIVSYPLAPNSPARDSIRALTVLYDTLLRQSHEAQEEIVFMGDSAGGNVAICLVTTILARDRAAPVPHSIFLISPCADMSNSNPQIHVADKKDPILTAGFTGGVAKAWTMGMDASDPSVSPVSADLGVLRERDIRLHGIMGTADVLYPDAKLLFDRAKAAGVSGRWLVWEGQMHCFPLAW